MKQAFFILFLTALIRPLPGQDLPSRACNDQHGHNRYWHVFSDRDDNLSYKYPGGTEKKSNLHFLEQFLVAEREGEYLHIYKDTYNVNFPQISAQASCYGWIHQDFLLLDMQSEAIALWSMKGKEGKQEIKPEQRLYKDPAFNEASATLLEDFHMLYVHKKTAGAVFLAKSVLLRPDPEDPGATVAGWYPSSQVEIWENRMVLEPNWEQGAFRERQANDIIPAVFSSRRAAEDYYLGGEVHPSSILWTNEPGAKRYGRDWTRFPILEMDDQGICKVRVFQSRDQQYDGYFSHEGYTCMNVSGNIYPLFKPVLHASNDDLAHILYNLQKLVIRQGSMNSKRQQMQNVWLELLEAQLGFLKREEFLSYSMDEIYALVNDGIPIQSSLIKHIRLQDITDPSVLSDLVFERYRSYLEDKISSLRIILTEGYEQSYVYESIRYYWIPIEDFP